MKQQHQRIGIRLKGGLGNQLFIYATGFALHKKSSCTMVWDTWSGFVKDPFKRKFALGDLAICHPVMSRFTALLWQLRYRFHFLHQGYQRHYPNQLLSSESIPSNIQYLDTYGQDPSFFKPFKDQLSKQLLPSGNLQPLMNFSRETVVVHARLGRNLAANGKPVIPNPDGTPTLSRPYFEKAKAIMEKKIAQPQWFIISDQAQTLKDWYLFPIENTTFVAPEHQEAMALLHIFWQAPHLIISNSTLSWWGAWLSPNAETVIAPDISYWDAPQLALEDWRLVD